MTETLINITEKRNKLTQERTVTLNIQSHSDPYNERTNNCDTNKMTFPIRGIYVYCMYNTRTFAVNIELLAGIHCTRTV